MTTIDRNLHAAATERAVRTHNTRRQRQPTLSYGPIFAKTTAILTILFTLGVMLPMWLLLDDPATGIGVGLMCAVWGGPGFGAMIAGAIWMTRNAAQES